MKLDFSVCVLSAVSVSVWCFMLCLLSLCGARVHGLWCVSTYFVVRFECWHGLCLGMLTDVLREKEFWKKEGSYL